MGFFLFLLVTAALFVRPGEISAEWYGWPIYQYLILACFAVSIPSVFNQLLARRLSDQPITVCVVCLLPLVVLSHLGQAKAEDAAAHGFAYFKVLVYYLLLVSLVTTPARLQIFLYWLIGCCTVLTLVTVLQFHGAIELPTVKARVQDMDVDQATNEEVEFDRMQGSGIFQDPNDLCLMLAACVPLCLFSLTDRRFGPLSAVWLGPLALFLYAISLTHSRGGLLALLAGLAAILHKRLGGRKALLAGLVLLPLVLVFFAGRQTNFSTGSGTSQSRIQLWREWLDEFRTAPHVGVGAFVAKEDEAETKTYQEGIKHVAHNAYLQSFADMGVLGGFFFVGVFYFAVWSVGRLGTRNTVIVDPQLRRAQPFVLGTIVAYAVGMIALSLCYVVPTYLMLGLAHAYGQMTAVWPPPPPARFGGRVALRLALISVAFLALTYVAVRVLAVD
jgi:O-antigen ligase